MSWHHSPMCVERYSYTFSLLHYRRSCRLSSPWRLATLQRKRPSFQTAPSKWRSLVPRESCERTECLKSCSTPTSKNYLHCRLVLLSVNLSISSSTWGHRTWVNQEHCKRGINNIAKHWVNNIMTVHTTITWHYVYLQHSKEKEKECSC